NWGDWLGTGNIHPGDKKYRSFNEARKLIRKFSFKSTNEFRAYCKLGKLPNDIPSAPDRVYKNDGWVSFGDWLGNKNVHPQKNSYLTFTKAREFAGKLNLKGKEDWFLYCKNGEKPTNIPAAASSVYKNKGWISWQDFLGKK
ncbi:MAG: hypothetical protein RLZZ424_1590, partial [Bacteroidota bacterium]